MKGKPQGGVAGKVASSSLAYPGNSFKYSPKCPTDEPQQKLNVFGETITTTALQSGGANITTSVGSNGQATGSVVLLSAGQPHNELSKDVSEAGPVKHSRLPSQKCDEIYSLSEEDAFGSGGQNQEQLQIEEVIVEVLQKVEKDIQEIEHSCKEHAKEVKNGPKKYKN